MTSRRFSSGSVVTLLVLAAVLAWFGYIQFFSPEREVRSRMNDVASALSTSLESSDLARLARVMRLRDYLADDVHLVDQNGLELDSRDAVVATAARWATAGDGTTVDFIDLSVTIGPDGQTAESYFTAQLSGSDPLTHEATVDARDVITDLVRRDGQWLISRVEARPTAR
jgi:ketosteroid isomerase-like protein